MTRIFCLAACTLTVLAQGTVPPERDTERGAKTHFEVATLKANKAGGPASWVPATKNDQFIARNDSLRQLLPFAYGVKDFQISGPSWLADDRYDVSAKLPLGATPDQVPDMLRALLEERLNIATHKDSVDQKVYFLVVAKGGPKFHEVEPDAEFKQDFPKAAHAFVLLNGDMATWGETLAKSVDRPVLDKTGLGVGTYKFLLAFDKKGEDFPDVFGAVEQELGLHLEPGRAKVDILVVDRADRVPKDN